MSEELRQLLEDICEKAGNLQSPFAYFSAKDWQQLKKRIQDQLSKTDTKSDSVR